jgi:hypothetical protein
MAHFASVEEKWTLAHRISSPSTATAKTSNTPKYIRAAPGHITIAAPRASWNASNPQTDSRVEPLDDPLACEPSGCTVTGVTLCVQTCPNADRPLSPKLATPINPVNSIVPPINHFADAASQFGAKKHIPPTANNTHPMPINPTRIRIRIAASSSAAPKGLLLVAIYSPRLRSDSAELSYWSPPVFPLRASSANPS